jgi:hypothetical protein
MKTVWKMMTLIGSMLLGGFVGMLLGALIGGNHFENFMFNGLRGYEATGQLGAIIGALLGIIITWYCLFRKPR